MTNSLDGARYAELLPAVRICERTLFVPLRTPNELELQARWFAGEFGRNFVSTGGDRIDIVQFGTWNREAGPDFKDAAIRVNGGKPRRGCVEIDLVDRSWETHGHSTNTAFDQTVLHVFVEKSEREFFTRTKSNRNVPQVRIDPATLPEAFSANLPLARPGRCHAPLENLAEERILRVLDAAAQFRLQKKAARMRAKIENYQSGSDDGQDNALFQEIATAFGYKENKLPFTLIAQRLSLKSLRQKLDEIEAILFGLAGFLEAADLAMYKESTRTYVRGLWDRWWPRRDEMQRLILPGKVWKLSSTRPANHPQRRLAALSVLARNWPAFRRSLGQRSGRVVRNFLGKLDHPFWKFRYTLTANPAPDAMALIGESRVTEILANVIFPFWCAQNTWRSTIPHRSGIQQRQANIWKDYASLRARLTNRRLETAAVRLFGADPRRREFTKTVAHQQALLQIYEDFCLQDNSDCEHCPFPEQIKKW
jgi:Protein of unknown function (DUF2851)